MAASRCALWGEVCNTLPICEDKEEACYMARLLCDIVCSGSDAGALLGSAGAAQGFSAERVGKVLYMLSTAGGKRSIYGVDFWGEGAGGVSLQRRVAQALGAMQASVPGAIMAEAFKMLPAADQKALEKIASGGV